MTKSDLRWIIPTLLISIALFLFFMMSDQREAHRQIMDAENGTFCVGVGVNEPRAMVECKAVLMDLRNKYHETDDLM
jgi:hypothetical protein